MNRCKPYLAYEDTGVEWISGVSEHWETLGIKWGALMSNEQRNDSPEG